MAEGRSKQTIPFESNLPFKLEIFRTEAQKILDFPQIISA